MMKNIIILLIIGGLFASCSQTQNSQKKPAEDNPYLVELDAEFYLALDDAEFGLEESIELYKIYKSANSQELNFDNSKKVMLSTIYQSFQNILTTSELTQLEYIAEEYIAMDYINNPLMFSEMLEYLNFRNKWTNVKTSAVAEEVLKENMKYVSEKFPNPDEIFSKDIHVRGYEKLMILTGLKKDI